MNNPKFTKENQNIVFVFTNTQNIFDYSKNYLSGDHHNIINKPKNLNEIYQSSNSSAELELVKKENEFLKNQVEFLTRQLEMTQGMLNKAITK